MVKLTRIFLFCLLLACVPTVQAAEAALVEPCEILDPSFAPYVVEGAEIELLAEGTRKGEGPVWLGDMRCLLWVDIANNRIMKWDEDTGETSIFRKPANYPNGMILDRYGKLIVCEHSPRQVTRTEHDGSITVLADSFDGKKLNSPNDVAVKSDNSIWFTDPPFGIFGHYLGHKAEKEQPFHGVYRVDGYTGEVTLVWDDLIIPNGIAFSLDEKILYVVDSAAQAIFAFDLDGDRKLTNKRVYADCTGAIVDGIKLDVDGNIWCGFGGPGQDQGVAIFNPEGKKIGFVHAPTRIANIVFGGEKRNRQFMTTDKELYALYVDTQGAPPIFAK